MSRQTVQVSVVIPTFKRPALLEHCLAAVLAQKFDPAAYEVLIVDDEPSPLTQQVVEGWAQRPGGPALRYVPVTGVHGPAAARNVGWRAATGTIIAFTDDDCLPSSVWLAVGAAALAEPVDGGWGRVKVPLPPQPTDYARNVAQLEQAGFLTANCFCRRETLEAVGGFDERFTSAFREDSDLYFTLLESGKRLVYLPDAVVVHPARPGRWGISLAEQRKGQFNALLYKKHPRLFRRCIQPPPNRQYYGVVAGLLGAVSGVVSGQDWLALGAGGIWLGMTGRFCARRLQGTSSAFRHVGDMVVTSVLIPPLALFWRLYGAIKYRVWFY